MMLINPILIDKITHPIKYNYFGIISYLFDNFL